MCNVFVVDVVFCSVTAAQLLQGGGGLLQATALQSCRKHWSGSLGAGCAFVGNFQGLRHSCYEKFLNYLVDEVINLVIWIGVKQR